MRALVLVGIAAVMMPGAALGARAAELADYLPAGVEHDPAIPKPAEVLAFEIGERHVRHDQLLRYLEVLASRSERAVLEEQGLTHEGRRQVVLILTSPANHARLEEIRREHVALTDPEAPAPSAENLASMPAVVFLGYSIHGNEASGSNASLAVAYHLAAGRGDAVEGLLEEVVVLLDPSLNPDGMGRFAQWVNSHRGERLVADPDHREHREVWPGGRTNHYWFDLNRDWLLLQHPESRARVETFHRWKPNLLGDYHEMGTDATYFFQPGVPARKNPTIPERNQELTQAIAAYHAEALDSAGRLYYTEETFDDFYPGKGSTYPDLNGAVGVLFEQASARGHLQESAEGEVSFPFAIQNQAATSYSMLKAARALREDLLAYQLEFYRTAAAEAARDPVKAHLVGFPEDAARAFHLRDLLERHRIEVRALTRSVEAGGHTFEPEWAFAVPTSQAQHRLVKELFTSRTRFEEAVFYDVSAWALPHSFGALHAALGSSELPTDLLGERLGPPEFPAPAPPKVAESAPPYAYAFSWSGYYAPRALGRLLEAGLRPRALTRAFEAETDRGRRRFAPGTIAFSGRPSEGDSDGNTDPAELVQTISARDGVEVFALASGLTPSGVDLGSPNAEPLQNPRILLAAGEGLSGYEVGEVWHLLDHRMGLPVSLVEPDRLGRLELGRYTHVLLVDGDSGRLGEHAAGRLRAWVEAGGTLVATKRAALWAGELLEPREKEDEEAGGESFVEEPKRGGDDEEEGDGEKEPPARVSYASFADDRALESIAGSIFEVEMDLTHPLAFGYAEKTLSVFRNSTVFLEPSRNPYENVAFYTEKPHLAGHVSEKNLERIAGGVAVIAGRLGRGTVVRLADNPSFRGVWYSTDKLLLNAIFFGPVLERTQAPEDWGKGRGPREDLID